MTLLNDPRFLGATPGLVMALHTWGRTLSHHPHVHCLVSGGGLTAAGEWKQSRNGYLLSVRVVKALFRGKLLGAIEEGLRTQRLHPAPTVTALDWARTLKTLLKRIGTCAYGSATPTEKASYAIWRATSKAGRSATPDCVPRTRRP